jgi:3-carboxy-cis,cis-muconate cycloisomerase
MPFHLDGVLFADLFGTEQMRDIFDERGFVERFLQTEAALARAEARVGLVPEAAAEEITHKASPEYVDETALAANVAEAPIFAAAIVETWTAELGDAGRYVHWGSTSHDIADTAFVLQIRDGLRIVRQDLKLVRDRLDVLATGHAGTTMPGRTQYVHGPPVTFGLRAAQWRDEIDRHVDRLRALTDRITVVELFGSTGTLAAIESDGTEVLAAFADELDLGVPDTPWIASRDRYAELVSVFAGIAGTLEGISRNLLFMNRPEVGEITLAPPTGSGSSTNPHKQNPVRPQFTVALARLLRGHAQAMGEATAVLGQRDRSSWHVEFAVIPESFLYLGRALVNTLSALDDVVVRPGAMRQNVRDEGSLPVSEAVMIALAEHVGRQSAHEIVHENVERSRDGEDSFRECLLADERVTAHLSPDRVADLTDPENYRGLAAEFAASRGSCDSSRRLR